MIQSETMAIDRDVLRDVPPSYPKALPLQVHKWFASASFHTLVSSFPVFLLGTPSTARVETSLAYESPYPSFSRLTVTQVLDLFENVSLVS